MPKNDRETTSEPFRLARFLPHRLEVATDQVCRTLAERYNHSFNLTLSEWRLLAVVAEHDTSSPTAAGQHAAMDKVKVSRAAHSLVTKGLLRQTHDPKDGRGRLLRLTRKGTTAHAGMGRLAMKLEAEIFDGLTRAESLALDKILTKINNKIEMNGLAG